MMTAKNSRMLRTIPFLTVACLLSFPARAQFAGGSGTADNPYQIAAAEQLVSIGSDPNLLDKHFVLVNDIDLAPGVFSDAMIAPNQGHSPWFEGNLFTGSFDGNGHCIRNLTVRAEGRKYVGLFGIIFIGGRVCNLRLCDVVVKGAGHVGGLVGLNIDGTITNCEVTGSVSGEQGEDRVGGLVGYNGGPITDCDFIGSVSGEEGVGGLVGYNSDTITNCYSHGSVTGDRSTGGLVGHNSDTITNCYSSAGVSTDQYGGLVGSNPAGMVYNSFWDVETSGMTSSAGGTGKTTAEMQDINTFLAAGWDFVGESQNGRTDSWAMPVGGGYPVLWWQLTSEPDLPSFSGGTGAPDDPYLISTADQLNSIGDNPRLIDAHFKLMSDIDLTGVNFFPIGSESAPFTGVFDGSVHTISNFSHSFPRTDYVGLFAYLKGEDAQIKDLGLIEPHVNASARSFVGSLLGRNGGTIIGCYALGGSVSGGNRVGGLVGYGGTLTNCYSSAAVSGGGHYVGGLVGDRGTIINCFSSGSVSGADHVGGLLGSGSYTDTISGCYATGAVTGRTYVGGLVGSGGTIINCYAAGAVSGNESVGGLIGSSGSAYGSYWDTRTSGQTTSYGGTGKTTAEMQMAATFLGWDACGDEGIWTIDEGRDYPRLWWEEKPGEVLETQQLSDLLTGTGTEHEPYLIYTAQELGMLALFTCGWDKHFKLMADIDLSAYTGTQFSPIGIWGGHDIPFSGVFDGNGHTISNFSYTSTGMRYGGLFGYVGGENAEIRDLGLIAPKVDTGGENYAGSLAAHNTGTITGCYAQDCSISGATGLGGLVGYNDSGSVSNCYATGSVSGDSYVGGLVGINNNGTVSDCHARGTVSGSHGGVGGLVGNSRDGTIIIGCFSSARVTGENGVGGLVGEGDTIINCFSSGSVSGEDYVGGLAGFNEGTITNCFSSASVSGDEMVGGLLGRNRSDGVVSNCYASGTVSGTEHVGGLVGNSNGTVSNCYAGGGVSGDEDVGGLVGYCANAGNVSNCYASGPVTGTEYVGGLAGMGRKRVHNCFWDMQTSRQTTSEGGTGKTTAEMQMETTFTDAGWDFVDETDNGTEDIWTICEGIDYPRFTWRYVVVDFDADYDTDFADFCILAERWLGADGSFWCRDGCDLTDDGKIDFDDVKEFAENWLTQGTWRSVVPGFIVVDNFERYNDYPPDRIFETWIDGYGYSEPAPGKEGNGTGSTVGYLTAPFAERNIVHGGAQSMPFGYDNTRLPYYSEAEREYLVPQNFMSRGVESMSLWIYGNPGNAPAEVYVGLQDSTGVRVNVAETNTDLVRISSWQEITTELSKFGPVNLASIKKIYIGAGDRDDPKPGGKGALYIDDIVLR